MKTEVKLLVALGGALVVIVGAAYYFAPKKDVAGTDSTEIVSPSKPIDVEHKPAVAPSTPVDILTTPGFGAVPSTRATTLPIDIFPPTQPTSAPATEPAAPVGIKADWDSLVGSKSGMGTGTGHPDHGAVDPAPPKIGTGTSGNTYTVKKGDTFSVISTAVYGSPNFWAKIAAANPGVSSNKLKIGQVIKVPPISEVKPSESEAPKHTPVGGSSLVRDSSSEYAVQAGDTLSKISQKLYGNTNKADAIYKLNKEKIGSSPNRLKVGMVLKLPTSPKTPATLPARSAGM